MLIFSLIYLILTINICSYAYYRSKFNGRAILKVKKPAKGTQKMTYLLPGFSANPEKSFSFLTEVTLYEKSAIKGGITLVEYRNLGLSENKSLMTSSVMITALLSSVYLLAIK